MRDPAELIAQAAWRLAHLAQTGTRVAHADQVTTVSDLNIYRAVGAGYSTDLMDCNGVYRKLRRSK